VKEPLISIVMPTFNRLVWLRPAIQSVFEQKFEDWELIVADDGSDEPTREYLRAIAADQRYRVRVLFLEHAGNPSAALNAGLREARASFVAFMDSDDVWLSEKLETQLASLRARPDCEWSFTRAVLVDGKGRPIAGRPPLCPPTGRGDGILEALLRGDSGITQSSVVARREAVARAGGYPEDLPICGNYALYVQLAARSEVDYIDAPLTLIRRHGEHHCDEISGLTELRRFLLMVERSGVAPQMAATLRARRDVISAGLAKAQAASGLRLRALATLAASSPRSWRHRAWWSRALATAAHLLAPAWLKARVRRRSAVVSGQA
jgi:glycosyltransferase involved in cell wall biosynthesis